MYSNIEMHLCARQYHNVIPSVISCATLINNLMTQITADVSLWSHFRIHNVILTGIPLFSKSLPQRK
jgi:hypothetical protein